VRATCFVINFSAWHIAERIHKVGAWAGGDQARAVDRSGGKARRASAGRLTGIGYLMIRPLAEEAYTARPSADTTSGASARPVSRTWSSGYGDLIRGLPVPTSISIETEQSCHSLSGGFLRRWSRQIAPLLPTAIAGERSIAPSAGMRSSLGSVSGPAAMIASACSLIWSHQSRACS